MGIIFEREIKTLLKNVKAVLCIALFAAISGVFFIVNNLSTGYSSIQPVFSNMSLAAALIIPLVASLSICAERKRETDEFIAALPVSRAQAVMGKFFALLAFFMIPTAVMALYPLVLALSGATSVLQGYIIFAMFVFIEVFFIALSLMLSAIFNKTWVAIAVSYAVNAVLFILGMISSLFSGVFKEMLEWISPFRRFDPIVFDLLDLNSLLFYLSFTAVLLVLTVMLWGRRRGHTDATRAANKKKIILAASIAVIALILNVAGAFMPSSAVQLDVSTNKLYNISSSTKEYLKSLDQDITVYLINPNLAEKKLQTFIERFCEQSGRITLKTVDTTKDTEFLDKYGITTTPSYYSMLFESSTTKRYKLVDSEECFSYYYGGDSEYVAKGFMSPTEFVSCQSYYSQMYQYYQENGASSTQLSEVYAVLESLMTYSTYCFNPEEPMTTAIEYVTAEKIPSMYFLNGHGEKNTGTAAIEISEKEIPNDAMLIIINDPDSDITSAELTKLQKYSDRGGKLLILTDKNIDGMENMKRLLSGFGVSAESGIVSVGDTTKFDAAVDEGCEFLAGTGITEVNVAEVSSIITAEIDGLEFSPVLNVEVPAENTQDAEEGSEEDSEPETVKKAVAMAVKKNGSAKLIWFTGADSFNMDTSKMTDEEKEEYAYTAYCIQYSSAWLRTNFTSALTFGSPKAYSSSIIPIGTGAAVIWGMLFVAIVPLALICSTLLVNYTRKKRSNAAVGQQTK